MRHARSWAQKLSQLERKILGGLKEQYLFAWRLGQVWDDTFIDSRWIAIRKRNIKVEEVESGKESQVDLFLQVNTRPLISNMPSKGEGNPSSGTDVDVCRASEHGARECKALESSSESTQLTGAPRVSLTRRQSARTLSESASSNNAGVVALAKVRYVTEGLIAVSAHTFCISLSHVMARIEYRLHNAAGVAAVASPAYIRSRVAWSCSAEKSQYTAWTSRKNRAMQLLQSSLWGRLT